MNSRLGKHNEAIIDFNIVIHQLKPKLSEAYYNRGVVKAELVLNKKVDFNPEKAITDFNKAIELDPELKSKLNQIINKLKNKKSAR